MADKVKDLVIRGTGGAESTAPIVLHDNADGTFSEGVYPGVVHTLSDDTALVATNGSSTAFENSRVLKNSAGWLWSFSVHNKNNSPQWVMLFDLTALPANATVPKMVWPIGAQDTLEIEYLIGRYCGTGIVLAASSTEASLTVATDASVLIDGQVS